MQLEHQIVSRIQQYIPDLRKQLKIQMVKQFHKTNKELLQQRTNQIRQLYTNKLKNRANEIKQNVSSNLMDLHKQISACQQQISEIKNKKLGQEDKKQLIEQMVDQIISDTQMLERIKKELHPQVQENVFAKIQANLQVQLQQFQKNQKIQLDMARQEWEEQRQQYWRSQSERDLQILTQQQKQLQSKKVLIQESLTLKKSQRDRLLRQQNNLNEINSEIAYIKGQIKLLS